MLPQEDLSLSKDPLACPSIPATRDHLTRRADPMRFARLTSHVLGPAFYSTFRPDPACPMQLVI
jgi:hypothetical protein